MKVSFYTISLLVGALLILCGLLYIGFITGIKVVPTNSVPRHPVSDSYKVDLWFLAVKDHTSGHITYAKQAILSARSQTDLIPIVILDGKDDDLEKWLKLHDTMVVHVEQHPVMKYLRDSKIIEAEYQGIATWQRIVLPDIISDLTSSSNSNELRKSFGQPKTIKGLPAVYANRTIHTDYVLYTDADVLFVNPFQVSKHDLPRYVGMAIQGDRYCCGDKYASQMHSNAGVLLMNVTGYAEAYDEFISYIKTHEHYISENALDQTALQSFFPQRMSSLSLLDHLQLILFYRHYYHSLSSKYYSNHLPKRFEWEPYLGYNADAVILHWHGIKYYVPEELCPTKEKPEFDMELVSKTYDFSHIQEFIREPPDASKEKLSNYKKLLTMKDLHLVQEGYRKASDLYFKYMRQACGQEEGGAIKTVSS